MAEDLDPNIQAIIDLIKAQMAASNEANALQGGEFWHSAEERRASALESQRRYEADMAAFKPFRDAATKGIGQLSDYALGAGGAADREKTRTALGHLQDLVTGTKSLESTAAYRDRYDAMLKEGNRAIDRRLAASGLSRSGRAAKELSDWAGTTSSKVRGEALGEYMTAWQSAQDYYNNIVKNLAAVASTPAPFGWSPQVAWAAPDYPGEPAGGGGGGIGVGYGYSGAGEDVADTPVETNEIPAQPKNPPWPNISGNKPGSHFTYGA